jgi:hypothetical protein
MLIRMLLHTFDTHTCEGIKIARLCAVPCALCPVQPVLFASDECTVCLFTNADGLRDC